MAPNPYLRIAILEADTPIGQTQAQYGGYGGVFKALLELGAAHIGLPLDRLVLSNYDVVTKMEYPKLDDIDAVLITGSRHDSFESDEWILKLVDFSKQVLAQDRVRTIGVCFGHQIIARALEAKVGRNDRGWEASVCKVDLTPRGKELFGGLDQLAIHQMHRDIVYEYPPGIEALGSSPTCEVQGMYAPRRLMSVQGHPEFNEHIVRELLEKRHELGILNDELYKDTVSRVADRQDGVIVAGAFLKFLLDGR